MKLGKHEQRAFDFIKKVKGWHSFAKDSLTKKTIAGLESKGLVVVNVTFSQFREIKGVIS